MRFRMAAAAALLVGMVAFAAVGTGPAEPDAADAQHGEPTLQVPDTSDVEDSIEDPGGAVEDAVTGNATDPDVEGPLPSANATADADVIYATAWTFDLVLDDDGTRFRFMTDTLEPRNAVVVDVRWQDDDGEPTAWPGAATLLVETDGDMFTVLPEAPSDDVRRFRLDDSALVAPGSTPWRLGIEVAGAAGTTWWSPYDAAGPQEALIEGAAGASARMLGTQVWVHDTDGDAEPDDRDNCPEEPNPDQENLDGDLQGDACDADDDGDGWSDATEQEVGSDPRDRQSTPVDRDADGYSNEDEAAAGSDPDDPASTPRDADADGYETIVEEEAGSDPHDADSTPDDPDADGLESTDDNCPSDPNPGQADGDADGIGDACDRDPDDGPEGDQDGDTFANAIDVCPTITDPRQRDIDGDGLGDACDADRDGDGRFEAEDAFPTDPDEWLDTDGDGTGDNADQDDDNDGLSDAAEEERGTDAEDPDSDGDMLSDLDEVGAGSDPLDPHDPPYLPTAAQAEDDGNGTVRITWDGREDPRIVAYTVWDRADLRVVAHASASASLVEDHNASGDAILYAIQPRFANETFRPDPDRSAEAVVFLTGSADVGQAAAGGTGPGAKVAIGPGPGAEDAPVEESPGLPAVASVALLVGLVLSRRRR